MQLCAVHTGPCSIVCNSGAADGAAQSTRKECKTDMFMQCKGHACKLQSPCASMLCMLSH